MSQEQDFISAPRLRLDGFDGPMDLLLSLARQQKVDLTEISILDIVEQYLAVVAAAKSLKLEIAADWLVMAAWLTWLKSCLLLPSDAQNAEEGDEASQFLQDRLLELSQMQMLSGWLDQRDRLGRGVYARGCVEVPTWVVNSPLKGDLYDITRAYFALIRRVKKDDVDYKPQSFKFLTTSDALKILHKLLKTNLKRNWVTLDSILSVSMIMAQREQEKFLKAARAGMLMASLELTRSGLVEIAQDGVFQPIKLRKRRP